MPLTITHSTPADGTFSATGAAAWDATHTLSVTGTSGQIQYNNAGDFAGMSGTSWNDTTRSLTLTGATVTASAPVLDLSQTWNNAAVTFTGLKFNVTATAFATGSTFIDFQKSGTRQFAVRDDGRIYSTLIGNDTAFAAANSAIFFTGNQAVFYSSGGEICRTTSSSLQLALSLSFSTDLFLTRRAAANLRLGAADAASPVAQTLSVQSVVAGTTNTAGANFTITGSQGTGTGAGGSIIFQVAPAGASGTAQNALSTALTINSASQAEFAVGSKTNPTIKFAGLGGGLYGRVGGIITFSNGTVEMAQIGATVGAAFNDRISLAVAGNDWSTTGGDTILARDAANTLALRNGTNAQLFRVYSTFNGTNDAYGAIGAGVNLDGTAGDANTLYIGSQKKGSPTALTKLALQVDGVTRADFNITASSTFAFKSNVRLDAGLQLYFSGTNANSNIGAINGTFFTFQSASAVTFSDWALTGNVTFQFGGTTSSFPALKRVSANLQVIAADNSGSAGFIVGNQALATTATDGFLYVPTCAGTPTGTPTTQTGTAPIVVDTTNNKLYFYSGGAWRDAGP